MLKDFIKKTNKQLGDIKSSPYKVALGFAVGVFASFSPFIGFHMIIVLIICFLIRASYVSGFIGTIVGNPFTFPFIYIITFFVGSLFVDTANYNDFVTAIENLSSSQESFLMFSQEVFTTMEPFLLALIIGWIIVGFPVSFVFYLLLLQFNKKT